MKQSNNDNEHNLDSEEERFVDNKIEEEMQNTLPKAPGNNQNQNFLFVYSYLIRRQMKKKNIPGYEITSPF